MVSFLNKMSCWVLVFFSITLSAYAEVIPLDRVVAVVDDDVILKSELASRIGSIKERLLANKTPLPPQKVLQERILDQLILESIQLQMADRVGLRVSDSELNQTMLNIAKQNNMSLERFQQQLAAEGVGYQAAREQIKKEMIISRFQQRMINSRIRVTDKEVEDYLQSAAGLSTQKADYHIAHILLPFNERDSEAKKRSVAQGKDLVNQVRKGGSFGQLAVTHSQSSSALQGGDLGWRSNDELPTLFANVVPKLKKGQVADPIVTDSAVHLVYLLDVKGGVSRIVQQSKTRHILIQTNELRDELESKKLIDDLYKKVKQGEKFTELAKAYSDDSISASVGGSLDWVTPGQMVPQFEQVMMKATIGEVSKPFQSPYGWHILLVEDRRNQDIGDKVQAGQARQVLHKRKYDEELQNWLGEIRDGAYVESRI